MLIQRNDIVEQSEKKWVLVTGASTGLGRACVTYLAAHGYGVYAGARKEKDLEDLNKIENVRAVKLDVTRPEDVQAAKTFIETCNTGLFGLVNNAGIGGMAGPIMDITEEELQQVFNVNVLGVHRVTRAMFPFILKAKGRVVMITSGNGRMAAPLIGPYSMSKFGLEGYSDSFREEMLLFGVKVIIIEPGPFKTAIWDKAEAIVEDFKKREHSIDLLAKIAIAMQPDIIKRGRVEGMDPIEVAKTVHRVLIEDHPRDLYPVS